MKAIQKAKKLIEESKKISILPSQKTEESIPAGLALFYTLKEIRKDVNFLLDEIPEKFHFLAPSLKETSRPKKFVISVPNQEDNISEIHYEKTNNSLNLYLKTKRRSLKKNQISFSLSEKKPDLLIALGVEGLSENDSFKNISDVPVLNINNKDKKKLGKINLIKNKTSLSELIIELFKAFNKEMFKKNTADCLLAGLIVSSNNSQDYKSLSGALNQASFLIKKGASEEKIIRHLKETENLLKKEKEGLSFLNNKIKR